MKRLFTLSMFLLISIASFSQLSLLNEDFNYSTGQLTSGGSGADASGGNWVSFSGTGSYIQVSSNAGLTYSGYSGAVATTKKISITSLGATTSQEDVYRGFSETSSGDVYISFLLNLADVSNLSPNTSATGAYFVTLLPSTSTSSFVGRLSVRLGTNAAKYQLGVRNGSASTAAFTTQELDPGTTYLIVMRYSFVTGAANDVIDLWINPALTNTPPASNLTVSDWTSSTEPAAIARLAIRQAGGASAATPSADIDGIKIGTTWTTSPLPLSLKSFNASLVNGRGTLSWSTSNEINVNGFAIEKSKDGNNFSQIDFVNAKNANVNSYNYTDAIVVSNTTYYRLKMVDKDGSYSFSKVVAINTKQSIKLDVYPNPVSTSAILSHTKASDNATIKVLDVMGRVILTQNVQLNATQTSVDLNKLTIGNYIVVFENEGSRTSAKLVKQ